MPIPRETLSAHRIHTQKIPGGIEVVREHFPVNKRAYKNHNSYRLACALIFLIFLRKRNGSLPSCSLKYLRAFRIGRMHTRHCISGFLSIFFFKFYIWLKWLSSKRVKSNSISFLSRCMEENLVVNNKVNTVFVSVWNFCRETIGW